MNAVTMIARGLNFRNGMTRQARNSRWSVPSRMCSKPIATNRNAAWCQRGSRRTTPGAPRSSNARSAPPGGRNRSTVTTRRPMRSKLGRIEKSDWSDWMS